MSTIRTRKNRQTGTMITVGRSDELQVNDGIGWAVTCEDHNVIMSCDTRKQAERQATAPLGWCQFCNGTADDEPCDCGKCAACITEEEHDGEYQELEPATMETTSEHCDTCHGTGDVPTGHTNHWGPVWGVCPECNGEGVVYICRTCMNTGIDLEAPFNAENPPPCPACTDSQHAA